MTGWAKDLPLLPGYYWVRIKGYERAPTIIETDIRDGAPMVLHEEPREPGQDGGASQTAGVVEAPGIEPGERHWPSEES